MVFPHFLINTKGPRNIQSPDHLIRYALTLSSILKENNVSFNLGLHFDSRYKYYHLHLISNDPKIIDFIYFDTTMRVIIGSPILNRKSYFRYLNYIKFKSIEY